MAAEALDLIDLSPQPFSNSESSSHLRPHFPSDLANDLAALSGTADNISSSEAPSPDLSGDCAAEWVSALHAAADFGARFWWKEVDSFYMMLETLPRALHACHPPSCPLKVQQALRVIGEIYLDMPEQTRAVQTLELYRVLSILRHEGEIPPRILAYLTKGKSCYRRLVDWPNWSLLEGCADILDEYLRQHVVPAPQSYLGDHVPPDVPDLDAPDLIHSCLNSFTWLNQRAPEYYWYLSNRWTSIEPLKQQHELMSALAALRNDYILRLESLYRRTFKGLSHDSARRKLQDLGRALQGKFSESQWMHMLWILDGLPPGRAYGFKHVVDDIVKPSGYAGYGCCPDAVFSDWPHENPRFLTVAGAAAACRSRMAPPWGP